MLEKGAWLGHPDSRAQAMPHCPTWDQAPCTWGGSGTRQLGLCSHSHHLPSCQSGVGLGSIHHVRAAQRQGCLGASNHRVVQQAGKQQGKAKSTKREEPELSSQLCKAAGAVVAAAPSSRPHVPRGAEVVTGSRRPCLAQMPTYRKETWFFSEAQHKQPSRCPWGRRAPQRQNPWVTWGKKPCPHPALLAPA